jgi:hypothetical protein
VEFVADNGTDLLKKMVGASPFDAYVGFLQGNKGLAPG